MTTIEMILLLCILIATVGLIIYFECQAAKSKSTIEIIEERPLTPENIQHTLAGMGANHILLNGDDSCHFQLKGDLF